MRAESLFPGRLLVDSPSRLTCLRTALWLALLTFPFAPEWIPRSFKLASINPVLAVSCAVLAYAWTIAAPVLAFLSLCAPDRMKLGRREHPQIALEAILGAMTPPFFTFSAAVLGWLHWANRQTILWYALLAFLAASRILRASRTKDLAIAGWKRFHRFSSILVGLFGLAHVINHLFALISLDAHVAVQNALRVIYRQPVVEVLLVASAFVQILTGTVMVMRTRHQRSTPLQNMHLLAGCFLAMFFLSHLTGVGTGRFVQKVDTTFAWATGGPKGLLAGARSGIFFPYYSLSVLAVFLHSAGGARFALGRVVGPSVALRVCYAMVVMGIVATIAVLLPMSGIRLG